MLAAPRGVREFSRRAVPGTAFRVPSFRTGPASADWSFDQRNLLLSAPAFELFFASDCILNMVERLVVNEPMDFVLFGEALN